MKFNCFPKKQNGIFLIYTCYHVFNSRYFNDLIIQSSPKNSIWLRLLNTNIGFLFSSFFRYEIEVPDNNYEYVGIIKGNKKILFEMINASPKYVWREDEENKWIKEKFFGFQLISVYTLKEFELKLSLIEKAFRLHWSNLLTDKYVHGDFTHFNILLGFEQEIIFIDRKSHKNSNLFDFFYFYSYFKQCLERCNTISSKDTNLILESLEEIILNICNFRDVSTFVLKCNEIIIPDHWGLNKKDKQSYLSSFCKIFVAKISLKI
tara:strand:- start:107 stop:895 length:789 start_codon:yes stop_codon:yes gene_type:complete